MGFALFYLLFFTLDILLIFRFQAFGLIPLNYLVAGVGLFCGVIFVQKYKCCKLLKSHRFVAHMFIGYVFIAACSSLLMPVFFYLFDGPQLPSLFHLARELVLLGYSGGLCLGIAIFVGVRETCTKWIVFSTVGGVLRFSIMRFDHLFRPPIPFLIWRYLGVFDLIMLFGWLMIIHTLIHEECDAESGIDTIPSFR